MAVRLERNVHRDIHVLDPCVHFVADRIGGNVIDVHFVNSIANPVGDIDVIDETPNLIRQSRLEFMADNVRDDVGEVGLIEGDRTERTILLLGEVFIHKGNLIPPRMGGK